MYICYIFDVYMKRFNFFLEQKWLDRLEEEKENHGHRSVSSFIRYIIIKFFEK